MGSILFAERYVVDSAAGRLRAAGLRVTPGRRRVLELLLAAVQSPRFPHAPLSHAEIKARLESSGVDIDRVTLYRILDSLLAAGIVLKAVDSRGVLRFSVAARRTPHDGHAHFRCEDCGGVFCIDAPLPVAPSLPDGFHLHGAELDLHGICARCGDAGEGHPA